jgi:hypothetical protein
MGRIWALCGLEKKGIKRMEGGLWIIPMYYGL